MVPLHLKENVRVGVGGWQSKVRSSKGGISHLECWDTPHTPLVLRSVVTYILFPIVVSLVYLCAHFNPRYIPTGLTKNVATLLNYDLKI